MILNYSHKRDKCLQGSHKILDSFTMYVLSLSRRTGRTIKRCRQMRGWTWFNVLLYFVMRDLRPVLWCLIVLALDAYLFCYLSNTSCTRRLKMTNIFFLWDDDATHHTYSVYSPIIAISAQTLSTLLLLSPSQHPCTTRRCKERTTRLRRSTPRGAPTAAGGAGAAAAGRTTIITGERCEQIRFEKVVTPTRFRYI